MQNDNVKLRKYLKIVTGRNNKVLRSKAKKIEKFTPQIRKLLAAMVGTMKNAEGIGLAAPQIGKSIQLFLVDKLAFDKEQSKWEFKKIDPPDVSEGFTFVNPSISSYPKRKDEMREGCLSLPGWDGIVSRPKRITIKAQTIEGKPFKLQARGLLAKVLQHEYDHLRGVLICDKWKNAQKVTQEKSVGSFARTTSLVFFGDSPYSRMVLERLRKAGFTHIITVGKEDFSRLTHAHYSLGVVAAFGKIIPERIIKKFRYGILNIHPSLLPKYRGPSPVQASIINGDTLTGVTLIVLSHKVDAGPIVAQREVTAEKLYTTEELSRILFRLGADLLIANLSGYLSGALIPKEQDEENATYTKLIEKRDGLVRWQESAQLIERKIRAYQPWPIAHSFFYHGKKNLRIQLLGADILESLTAHREVGKIAAMREELRVYCGKGTLRITKLRPEGKREMTGAEFLRGYAVEQFISYNNS